MTDKKPVWKGIFNMKMETILRCKNCNKFTEHHRIDLEGRPWICLECLLPTLETELIKKEIVIYECEACGFEQNSPGVKCDRCGILLKRPGIIPNNRGEEPRKT